MACSIFKSQVDRDADNRIVNVNAPNGNPSRLYNALKGVPKVMNPYDQVYLDALESDGQIGNWRDSQEEYALGLWSKIHTSRFDREFGANAVLDENNEPVVRGQYYLGKDGQNRPVHGDGSAMPEELETSGVEEASFDKGLAQKIQDKLQALYPEIKLKITNTPVWEQGDNVFNQEEYNNQVNYRLNATKKILDNLNKIKQWESNKSINQETLWKKIGELGVPKQQLDLLKETEGNTVEEKLSNFIATYSYTVEINTAKNKNVLADMIFEGKLPNTQYHSKYTVPGGINYTENEIATSAIIAAIKGHAMFATEKGIGWFRSDELRKIKDLPSKIRRILEVQSDLFQLGRDRKVLSNKLEIRKKGDTFVSNGEKFTVTNITTDSELYILITIQDSQGRIATMRQTQLEKRFDERGDVSSENQFLQLLNKDNNWQTFFIKSIIQDSAKKGYEKVLFPTGNTASKVEGHSTLEEFKKQKEDRIKELESASILKNKTVDGFYYIQRYLEDENGNEVLTWRKVSNENGKEKTATNEEINQLKERFSDETKNEINQLKQELERVEKEGFGALKPIYKFYETTVANILKKQGYAPKQITDEYGNTWNEITINQARDLSEVLLQRNEANQIIGQANIKAMSVLVDAVNQKQDTLPHEYAHHYIAWYRNTPIVQEAIKKWGSEEALVQSIGEQVVKQKGEAYNWWKKFVEWIMNQFNSLSKLQKEELTQILTDAFLTRQDLSFGQAKAPVVKPGVDELFESNPELANAVYETLGFKQNSKFKNSLWRGQAAKPNIDNEGNLILKPSYEELSKDYGKSFTTEESVARSYGNRYSNNPYFIEVDEDYISSNFNLRDDDVEGEKRIIGKNIIKIPKGKFNIINPSIKDYENTDVDTLIKSYINNLGLDNSMDEILFSGGVSALMGINYSPIEVMLNVILKKLKTDYDGLLHYIAEKNEQSLQNLPENYSDYGSSYDFYYFQDNSATTLVYEAMKKYDKNYIPNIITYSEEASFTQPQITPQQKQQAQQLYSQYLDTKNRLYRSETYLSADERKAPDWLKEQPEYIAQQEAQGRWFYKSLQEAQEHLKKFEGNEITYVDVAEDIEQYNARNNKFAGGYGREGKEYFVPKEIASSRNKLGSEKDMEGFRQWMQSQTDKDATALDNLISKLEQLGIIEKDCRGGGIKAKDGIRSKFTRGSQWELVKDLKGYPSHAQGGVDIQLGKDGFSFTRGESQVLAAHGLVLPKTK